MIATILLVLLVLLLVGALPNGPAPWAANWGPYPASAIGIILLVVVILLLTGRL
jgi:hypothetical protein